MGTEPIDGTMTRQLLPWGHASTASDPRLRAEIRRAFRWVTWFVVPVTAAQAGAHIYTGGAAACVVAVVRGPRGGWDGARFIGNTMKWPTKHKAGTTWHVGWVHVDEHPKDTMPSETMWRAHLELHAPRTGVT